MKLRKQDDAFMFVGLKHLGPFRLLRCSFTGATVRSLRRHEREFETMSGAVVAFNSPSRSELVAGDSLITKLATTMKGTMETASNLALLYDTSVEDAMLALKAGFTKGEGAR